MKWLAPVLAYLAVGLGLFVFQSAWGALVGFHLAILVTLFIAKPGLSPLILFQFKRLRWTVFSVLVCGSSGVTLYVLWARFGFAPDLAQQVQALGLSGTSWPPFILYFTLVNPLVEEYFWRGWLGSETTALHVSDFLYAGFHGLILFHKVQPVTILFALSMLVLAGWFWRQLYRSERGLLAAVLGHCAADCTILLAVYGRLAG